MKITSPRTILTLLMLLFLSSAQAVIAQGAGQVVPAVTKGAIATGQRKTYPVKVREADTSKENKEPRYYYLTLASNIMVNTTGGFGKRLSPAIEFGRTYGIFDIGLTIGTLNSLSPGQDTSGYIELRPTINVFSKGRFSEALCLGIGYIPKAKDGFMTEICNSINFDISETVAVAILQGYYFFDGENSNRTGQYVGLNLTYNFLRDHGVNKKRKHEMLINDK